MFRVLTCLVWTMVLMNGLGASALSGSVFLQESAHEADWWRSHLHELLESKQRAPLRVVAECRNGLSLESFVVYGNGIGIWNDSRQFRLPDKAVDTLVRSLLQADFPAMKKSYGGRPMDSQASGKSKTGGFSIRVVCRLHLSLQEKEKQVVQLAKGIQHAPLKKLAEELFRTVRKPGQSGMGADDLPDGLGKVAQGHLAPETILISLHRKPDEESAQRGEQGFLLTVSGDQAVTRSYDPVGGYSDPFRLKLQGEDIRRLAESLLQSDPMTWPANLYAIDYTDLTIRVLNHRKSVQARRFQGLTSSSHGDAQERFDAALERLSKLHIRVLNEGR